uniref:non-specific serine/threonine protein kinase n=1 Tax=Strix occidentalis caurina TaxID=311401 RepID=A0A8D0FMU5_STROC
MATCIGEKIEDFKVGNLLGKGSFAGVYRAVSLKTGLEVAIKMIDKKAMHKVGMVQRVQNEVKIHCQLKHPSILEHDTSCIKLSQVCCIFILMEYCTGTSPFLISYSPII